MRSRRHRGVAQDARTAVSPRGPARRAQPNGCIWPAPRLYLQTGVDIDRMEPEQLVSWRWHPAPIEAGVDYSKQATTLVVFELTEAAGVTTIRIGEPGADRITAARRPSAWRQNA